MGLVVVCDMDAGVDFLGDGSGRHGGAVEELEHHRLAEGFRPEP